MSKKIVDMDKFAVFILSHGRPWYTKTIDALNKQGYTGRYVLILDNEDKTIDEYANVVGYENVWVFNKEFASKETDEMNNFHDKKAAVYARNVCWQAARELGYDYFLVIDDDTECFSHKQYEEKETKAKNFDKVCKLFVEFLINTPCLSVSFTQGGDHIGGYDPNRRNYKRKCMNSWFCKTDRPFKFFGTMNDDINACIANGIKGGLFLTIYPFMLHQPTTQSVSGGVTDAYLKYGTYVKSFYSVMLAPSFIKIKMLSTSNPRLHHLIKYKHAYPCIISEEYKK